MMHIPLAGMALLISVAVGPIDEASSPPIQMSMQQRTAVVQRLMRSATECIARTVTADPRREQSDEGTFGELIVDAMPSCVGQVRAMIDAYDRYFGDGSGEAFFMGPYLDVLPKAVSRLISDGTE
jgi:hypothetical protein